MSATAALANAQFMAGILNGIRVLDFAHQVSGPYSTAILGDMGADVLKIESPGRGDGLRYDGKFDGKIGSPFVWTSNRNKRSVTLNLKDPRGHAIALDLARGCDVVVENFRPGVMDKLSLGYDHIKAVRPDVIYLSISAFGHEGPLAERPGQDLNLQAISGIMDTTGESNDRMPVKAGPPMVDVSTGVYGALAMALALFHRERTGAGQHIRISMLDCALSLQNNLVGALLMGTGKEGRYGSSQPNISPYQAYQGSDGRWFVIGCTNNGMWRRLCETTGLTAIAADPRFVDNRSRVANRAALNAILEPVLAKRTADEWVESFSTAELPSMRVNTPSEALKLEQVRANGMLQEMDHPLLGRHAALASPLHMQPPPSLRRHSPILGEHTDEVLKELGRSEADLRALRDDGVI